jgi:two-component system sensor histidine kinase VicK
VNIAAHELRAPIQPILGLTQIVRSRIKDSQEQQLLDTVLRNAKRLQRLTQDILDVSRIESKSLDLKKELFLWQVSKIDFQRHIAISVICDI